MLEIYPYDAGRGDCLRIRFRGESGTYHNILVDSGPQRFGPACASIFREVQSAGEYVDIQLITHTDEDHLGGLVHMADHGIPIRAGTVIMNHPRDLPTVSGGDTPLSVPQANRLFGQLTTPEIELRSGLKRDVIELDGAKIQILHPVRRQVEAVFGPRSGDTPLGILNDRAIPLEQLMERPLTYRDTSPSNRASIVFVLEYKEKKLLFAGDAWGDDILESVYMYARLRGEGPPVLFDAVKLPHHGSAGNISERWPEAFRARRYILCADGGRHPSKQTVAKLLRWYGDVEIVSPRDWWSNGYFSAAEVEQYIKSKRLRLTLSRGVSMSW